MSMNTTYAPSNLIGVEQQFFYTIYYGFLIALATIIILGAAWGIWWFVRTSPNARRFRKAVRKGMGVLTIGFDSGQNMIASPDDIGPEGYLKVKGKKRDYVFFGARAFFDEKLDTREIMSTLTKGQTIDGVPHVIAYAGKAIATNIKTLATLEYAKDELVAIGQAGTNAMPNGGSPVEPEIIKPPERGRWFNPKTKETLYYALWPVGLKTIKAAFDRSWNQAQVRALEKDAYIAGLTSGKKLRGLREWMPVIVILGLLVAALGFGVLLYIMAK